MPDIAALSGGQVVVFPAVVAGQFGPPQKRRGIGDLVLRPAAVLVQRDAVAVEMRRSVPVAGLDFAQREMPAEMAVEKPVTRIGGEPGGEESAGVFQRAALVTDMGEAVRRMRVFWVGGHRALYRRPSRR